MKNKMIDTLYTIASFALLSLFFGYVFASVLIGEPL